MRDLSAAWRGLSEWTASAADLTLSATQVSQLRAYLETLLLWNRKLALVSQQDPARIITKHIADSLFVASRCADGESVADLGSGAGLPGLPIAIARPTSRVCLVESRGRKVSFLEEARRVAAVRNAEIRHARIEALASDPSQRSRYAVVTARALTSLDEFLELARPLLAPGGRAIAMRAVGEHEPSSTETIHYELLDGTPRRLVILKLASR